MKVSMVEQLQKLGNVGIKLNPPITMEDLIRNFWSKEEFENDPYKLLLVAMGAEIQLRDDERYQNVCDKIWHLDTECIYNSGDYVRILERFKDLSQGEFNLENMKDYIDLDEEEASVSFYFKGQEYFWELEVDDDWIDTKVISMLVKLHEMNKPERHFTYLDLQGQDCLIGYCSKSQITTLRNITGLNFEWLR